MLEDIRDHPGDALFILGIITLLISAIPFVLEAKGLKASSPSTTKRTIYTAILGALFIIGSLPLNAFNIWVNLGGIDYTSRTPRTPTPIIAATIVPNALERTAVAVTRTLGPTFVAYIIPIEGTNIRIDVFSMDIVRSLEEISGIREIVLEGGNRIEFSRIRSVEVDANQAGGIIKINIMTENGERIPGNLSTDYLNGYIRGRANFGRYVIPIKDVSLIDFRFSY